MKNFYDVNMQQKIIPLYYYNILIKIKLFKILFSGIKQYIELSQRKLNESFRIVTV